MGPGGVFIALVEFDRGAAGSLLFEYHGIPTDLQPDDFDPAALRRPMREQAGPPTILPLRRPGLLPPRRDRLLPPPPPTHPGSEHHPLGPHHRIAPDGCPATLSRSSEQPQSNVGQRTESVRPASLPGRKSRAAGGWVHPAAESVAGIDPTGRMTCRPCEET